MALKSKFPTPLDALMETMDHLLGPDAKSASVDKAEPTATRTRETPVLGASTALPSDKDEVRVPLEASRAGKWRSNQGPAAKQSIAERGIEAAPRAKSAIGNRSAGTPAIDSRNVATRRPGHARTLVIIAPPTLTNDNSKTDDAVQTAIAAARALGVDTVVIQPGPVAGAWQSTGSKKEGRRVDVHVTNHEEMRAAMRLVISEERLGGSIEALPPIKTFLVIGASSNLGQGALAAIDEATAFEAGVLKFEYTVVVAEPDYLTITDVQDQAKRGRLPSGALHQLESSGYRPSDARALTQGHVLVGDAGDRLALQATTRLVDGGLGDLRQIPILQNARLPENPSADQIRRVVEARSISASPASHDVATRLRRGETLTRDQAFELNSYGNALITAGLTSPLSPLAAIHGIEASASAGI